MRRRHGETTWACAAGGFLSCCGLLGVSVVVTLAGCEPAPPPPGIPEPSEKSGTSTATVEPGATGEAPSDILGFGPGKRALDYVARRVGSEACGSCHPDEAAARKTHHMALTGAVVTPQTRDRWFAPGRLDDPVEWPANSPTDAPSYRNEEDGTFLTVREKKNGTTHEARVAAVFGSGHRGFTPLATSTGRGIRELRLSYFREPAHWVMTPGSEGDPDALGYVRTHETSGDCLYCHSTSLTWTEDQLDLDKSVLGIGCERCHGPGSAHIEEVSAIEGTGSIFNPGRLKGREQVAFCSECHRSPESTEPHAVLLRLPKLARHAGLSLQLSACFLDAPPESAITCLECHSPHHNIDQERGTEKYNATCLRCHSEPEDLHTSEISSRDNCVQCHMPVETRGFFGLSFTDHWIRVPSAPPPWKSETKDRYVRLLEDAYRQAIDGKPVGRERASKLHMRLGKLLVRTGRTPDGLRLLREALTFEPLYKDRILSAEYHRDAGQLDDARRILEETIRHTPEHNRAYYTLARLHAASDRWEEAAAVLDAWGRARPGDPYLGRTRRELAGERRMREGKR